MGGGSFYRRIPIGVQELDLSSTVYISKTSHSTRLLNNTHRVLTFARQLSTDVKAGDVTWTISILTSILQNQFPI